jgi:hypothetical protein
MKTQRIPFGPDNRMLARTFNNGCPAVLPGERAGARIKPRCQPLCSQPISDHGAGTVRRWAAVNLNSRHRAGPEQACSCARSSGPCPECTSYNHTSAFIQPAIYIARRTPLFLSPATSLFIHGPATAAGPASFYITASA